MKLTIAAATSEKPASNGVCQPGCPARKLKAAPLLNTSTRLKNPAASRRSPGAKRASTSHFTSWSASATAAARAYQRTRRAERERSMEARERSGMEALLSRPAQVGGAAPAQARGVYVGAVVPAALAFRV